MSSIDQMRADWDQRAAEDPFYYVAFVERGQRREEFLASAAKDLYAFEAELPRLAARERALEVGCGPGRLMLPMSRHFSEIHGVDISPEMVRLAGETLAGISHARAHVTPDSSLRMFADEWFDFIYSYAVFQHIPSRDVVENYMREIHRVLKPGAISCYQLRGAAPLASDLKSEAATWTGCFFTWDDVRKFASKNALQLVGVQGVGTQYMVITARKPAAGDLSTDGMTPVVRAVTPASGVGDSVPRSGRGAAISLWMEDLPGDCSLVDFVVEVAGTAAFACYIGPRIGTSGYQLNALLPAGLAAANADVRVTFRGSACGSFAIAIADVRLAPFFVSITDGRDVGRTKIRSASAKVTVENVANPAEIRFLVDGKPLPEAEFVTTDPVASQYEFALHIPWPLSPGEHSLTAKTQGISVGPLVFQVER